MVHKNLKIYGFVQGVSFRFLAKKKADALGLAGFARNEADGTVYIEVEGEDDEINSFMDSCKLGPLLAKVERVEVVSSEEIKDKTFEHFSYL